MSRSLNPVGPSEPGTGTHCCEEMAEQIDYRCAEHPDPYDCADNLLVYVAPFQEYGIAVHDGGSSAVTIANCPWCGRRLPDSQRDRWFEELERLGVDPWSDDVPVEYRDGSWLSSPGPPDG